MSRVSRIQPPQVITAVDPTTAAEQAEYLVGPYFGQVVLAPLYSSAGVARGGWNNSTTYAANDFVAGTATDVVYRSKQAGNLNHAVTDAAWWEAMSDDTARFAAVAKVCAQNGWTLVLSGKGVWCWMSQLTDTTDLALVGLLSNTTIELEPGYQHVCALFTHLGSLRAIPFFAGPDFSLGTKTELYETVVVGEPWISTNASVAVGTDVAVGVDAIQGPYWTLASHLHRITSTNEQIVESGDATAQLSAAHLVGVSASNTNAGVLYPSITLPAGNATVNVYKDVARTQLVAHGALVGNGGGTITLVADGGSGLTGTVVIIAAAVADDTTVWTCYMAAGHSTLTQGKYLLGLDRPCTLAFPAAYEVHVCSSYPKRIYVRGHGALMTGICDKHFCVSFCDDFELSGCVGMPDNCPGAYLWACDHDSRNGGFARCGSVKAANSGTITQFMLEASEDVYARDCWCEDPYRGFGIWSTVHAVLDNCTLTDTVSGGVGVDILNTDATRPHSPSKDVEVNALHSYGGAGIAIQISDASQRTTIRGAVCSDSTAGAAAIWIGDSAIDTLVDNAKCIGNYGAGILVTTNGGTPVGTVLSNCILNENEIGLRADANAIVTNLTAKNNTAEDLYINGAIRLQIVGLEVTSLAVYGIYIKGGAVVDMSHYRIQQTNDSSVVQAWGIFNENGTLRRSHGALIAPAATYPYHGDSANAILRDGEAVDDSGSPHALVFTTNAKYNRGTWVANGATEVAITNALASATMRLQVGMSALGGAPAGQPYQSALTAGTSFGMKAAAGDTSTYSYTIID